MRAVLALEDGNYFEGESFGAEKDTEGEVCFNTSLTGYQEILTDPSYAGQIVTLTYPEIGNYGINLEDVESRKVQISALVVKNCCEYPSNWRCSTTNGIPLTLSKYLKDNGIPGIQGIDTRRLVRILREGGVMNGVIVVGDYKIEDVLQKVKQVPNFSNIDFVSKVTIKEKEGWTQGENPLRYLATPDAPPMFTVAAIDYGIKSNILRILTSLGAKIVRFPATVSSDEIKAINPDGIFLSNGPGDPARLDQAVQTIKELIGYRPIFGICLGHQLVGRALGGTTYKLKFGHRGANHPVMDLRSGKVEITSQNHGFAIAPESLDKDNIEVTHINLNDQTVSGLRHKHLPIFSVQYHPEASPGPRDSHYLFEEFIAALGQFKSVAHTQNPQEQALAR